jgi:hypothetical protein
MLILLIFGIVAIFLMTTYFLGVRWLFRVRSDIFRRLI